MLFRWVFLFNSVILYLCYLFTLLCFMNSCLYLCFMLVCLHVCDYFACCVVLLF